MKDDSREQMREQARKFEQMLEPTRQTSNEIWMMMADFAIEQQRAATARVYENLIAELTERDFVLHTEGGDLSYTAIYNWLKSKTVAATERKSEQGGNDIVSLTHQLSELKRGLRNNNTDFELAFLDAYLDQFKSLRAEIVSLTQQRDNWKAEWKTAKAFYDDEFTQLNAMRERLSHVEEALKMASPYIEFYAEREIKSPSNNQEAVRETRDMLRTVREALAKPEAPKEK